MIETAQICYVFLFNLTFAYHSSALCPISQDNLLDPVKGCDLHCKNSHGTKFGRCTDGYCSCDELDPSGKYCKPICCTPKNRTELENGSNYYGSIVQILQCNNCTGQLGCQVDCISPFHSIGIPNNRKAQGCCIGRNCYCTLPSDQC